MMSHLIKSMTHRSNFLTLKNMVEFLRFFGWAKITDKSPPTATRRHKLNNARRRFHLNRHIQNITPRTFNVFMAATFQSTSTSISNWHTRLLWQGYSLWVPQFLAIFVHGDSKATTWNFRTDVNSDVDDWRLRRLSCRLSLMGFEFF